MSVTAKRGIKSGMLKSGMYDMKTLTRVWKKATSEAAIDKTLEKVWDVSEDLPTKEYSNLIAMVTMDSVLFIF